MAVQDRTMAGTFRSLQKLEALTVDSSRGLAQAALTALPHLSRLTSLDLMRSNPNLDLCRHTSPYAAPPPRSVPLRPGPHPLRPAALQRHSMTGRTSLDRGMDPRAPLFTPRPLNTPAAASTADTTPPPAAAAAPPTAGVVPEAPQPPEDPEHLAPFPSVVQLRLSHLINSSVDSIQRFLQRFPSLRALELLYCEQATRAALQPIATLSSLERLRLHACARVITLPNRSGLPPLKEVDLTLCTHSQNDALEALAGAPLGPACSRTAAHGSASSRVSPAPGLYSCASNASSQHVCRVSQVHMLGEDHWCGVSCMQCTQAHSSVCGSACLS